MRFLARLTLAAALFGGCFEAVGCGPLVGITRDDALAMAKEAGASAAGTAMDKAEDKIVGALKDAASRQPADGGKEGLYLGLAGIVTYLAAEGRKLLRDRAAAKEGGAS